MLDAFIKAVLSKTGGEKVDIVAHSMGGLVAKQYLNNKSNAVNVETFIMLGSPHLGTPKAMKALRYGDDLSKALDKCKVKRATHNLPGIYDLLPGRRYFTKIGGYFTDRADINNDGFRGKVNNFDQMYSTLYRGAEDTFQLCPLDPLVDPEPVVFLNPNLLKEGMVDFHDQLDYWEKPTGVKVFVIAGYNVETISTIIEEDSKLKTAEPPRRIAFPIVTSEGDETVPLISAETVQADAIYYANLKELKTIHSEMPGEIHIQNQVLGLLRNGAGVWGDSGLSTTRPTDFYLKALILSAFSPIRLSVYDSQGNHTGFLLDGSTEAHIPGSSVTEMGEAQHVALPEGDTYYVIIEGLDTGEFTLWQTELSETGEILRTFTWEDIPVNSGARDALTTQFSNPQNLLLDNNGDGIPEDTLPPKLYKGGAGPLRSADLNGDGKEDSNDFEIIRSTFGSCSGQNKFNSVADLDYDGCVTFADYRIWLQMFKSR